MKRRTAGILVGLLAVVCLSLVFSVVYPFSTAEPHATASQGDRFTVGDADAYTATGRIVVNGEERLAFEGVVTDAGGWYQKVREANVTSEEYRPARNRSVYQRLTITERERAERFRERITEAEDRTLHRENRDGDRVTFFVEQNATSATEPVSGTASVFVNSLAIASYTKTESDSSTVTVSEPRSGWYDGREAYRITGVTGAVYADTETHVVQSANVSWVVTEPAGTYAEYAVARVSGDGVTTQRIVFELDTDDTEIERPSWVSKTEWE